jgi:hypothetical protein
VVKVIVMEDIIVRVNREGGAFKVKKKCEVCVIGKAPVD